MLSRLLNLFCRFKPQSIGCNSMSRQRAIGSGLKGMGLALGLSTLGAAAASACTPTYTVAHGDSLSNIAERQLGTLFKAIDILDANRDQLGSNPNALKAGLQIRIPCDEAEAGAIDWSVMPTPDTVWDLVVQNEVQVLDIRDTRVGADGVVPRSISIPFRLWRGNAANPGRPQTADQLSLLIGNAGLRIDRPIVIVHAEEAPMQTGAAAYVYWVLKSVGAEQLAILRGGYKAWHEQGYPAGKSFVKGKKYQANVTFDWTWRADELNVYSIASGQVQGHLLDARPHQMFQAFDSVGQAIATTIPGAKNLAAPSILNRLRGEVKIEDGVSEVVDAFLSIGADGTTGDVITFCNVGELAALNWFYASELAGLSNIKLYPESSTGWVHSGGVLAPGKG